MLLISNIKIHAQYLVLFGLPLDLRSYYTADAYPAVIDRVFWLSLGLLGLLLVALIRFRRHRPFCFGWLWWGVSMAPVSNFYPLFQPMAERYLFWASVGPCLWLGWWWAGVWAGRRRPLVAGVVAILVLLFCSGVVVTRNRVWKDDLTVWSTLASRAPEDPEIEVHLATSHYAAGNYAEALWHGERTLRLLEMGRGSFNPAVLHLALGSARYMLDDPKGALREFLIAEQHLPARADIDVGLYENLAMVHERLGNLPAAVEASRRAVALEPWAEGRWRRLTGYLLRSGDFREAEVSWARARALRAELPEFAVLEQAQREASATK